MLWAEARGRLHSSEGSGGLDEGFHSAIYIIRSFEVLTVCALVASFLC